MRKVVRDLTRVHRLSREDARAATREVDRALVVLHESDQVTFGPSRPATTTEGWPSLGHGAVNSSIGGQQPPVATVLEQAALAVPADQRPHVRLLVRAVLTDSPTLAQDLRHGRTHLEPRTQAQRDATSPRGPPWTPAHVAATIATGHPPWHPPPAQEPAPSATTRPGAGQPHQPGQPGPATTQPGPTRTAATTAGRPRRASRPRRTGRASRPGPRPARRSWPTSRPEWPRRPARATSPGPRGRHSPGPAPPAPPACARPPSPTRPPPPYERHQHSPSPRQASSPRRTGRASRPGR
ncbi:hypothetical protein D5R93_07360 [Actinomyces lilanjuaniae]|uniref:Novel toxin 15 domain-containing protein n=1 Tax=Actinomyces lilanjuaniae TaxID=2321394 RepID=A0ABN5PSD5_9ACTO|nr:polymorphic toxin type 15 domain-containing protein [Actinomyces lilanjuaniae]AYD89887.1 hypothetical protein D5R93_07360 [Actinomyces lilanjuaniae]